MLSDSNVFVTVKQGVILNPLLDLGLASFERWFAGNSLKALCTSGERSAEHQLEIIKGFLDVGGYMTRFQEVVGCGLDDLMDNPLDPTSTTQIYKWQIAWSQLLSDYGKGYSTGRLVDPPRPAIVLLDYMHGGINHKGHLLQPSAHIPIPPAPGLCLDLDGNLDAIGALLGQVLQSKQIKQFCGYVIEPQNGSVHCEFRNV